MKHILIIFTLIFSTFSFAANASSWPTKDILIFTPYAPGNGGDILTRIIANALEKKFSKQFIVYNKPGAGTVIGTSFFIANNDPDEILFTSAAIISAKYTLNAATYDIFKDLVPVDIITETPFVLVTNNKYKTFNDFITNMRINGDKMGYGSTGWGSSSFLMGENLKHEFNSKINIVPYKATQEVLIDILAGRLDASFQPIQVVLPFIESGELTALVISSETRANKIPNVPTLSEIGYPQLDLSFWIGVFANKKMQPEHIKILKAALTEIKNDPKVIQTLADVGLLVKKPKKSFDDIIRDEFKVYEAIINKIKLIKK